MRLVLTLVVSLLIASLWNVARAEQVEVQKTDAGVTVTVAGQPFTNYVFKSGLKPILWPVVGPTGKEMTRAWPMREGNPDEKTDHVHQRSFWFTHGNINGIDFWAETAKPEVQGRIEHRELVEVQSGDPATLVTKNDWLGPKGDKILTDVRKLRFGADKGSRWIDFDITLTAAADEVVFGDTKEGSFGLRITETMRTDRKLGGKIITSEGLSDAEAWGKPAAWVDYHGPVQGESLGIAILNHPSSFRYPTTWHVRTYGLFAANPWGWGDFTKGQQKGEHTLKKGESLTLRYRVLFHKGDEKEGHVAEAFAKYSKE
jgi:hypothetical protein